VRADFCTYIYSVATHGGSWAEQVSTQNAQPVYTYMYLGIDTSMRVSTLLNLATLSESLDERIGESTLKIFDGWLFEYRSVDTHVGNCVMAASSARLYLQLPPLPRPLPPPLWF
jgi:hypothetical protein